jgi:hypothetical protein
VWGGGGMGAHLPAPQTPAIWHLLAHVLFDTYLQTRHFVRWTGIGTSLSI